MKRDLDDYLNRIEAAVTEGEALLRRKPEISAQAAYQKCVDAALLIGAYQLYIHRELFDPLAQHPDARLRAAACEIKIEGIALGEKLRTVVRGLSASGRKPELEEIAAHSRAFNPLVRAHVAKVRQVARTIDSLRNAAEAA